MAIFTAPLESIMPEQQADKIQSGFRDDVAAVVTWFCS
jgi:hypothetical protein